MQWTCTNGVWESPSTRRNADGQPYVWRITVGDDGVFTNATSDPELLGKTLKSAVLSVVQMECEMRDRFPSAARKFELPEPLTTQWPQMRDEVSDQTNKKAGDDISAWFQK